MVLLSEDTYGLGNTLLPESALSLLRLALSAGMLVKNGSSHGHPQAGVAPVAGVSH